jgi:hypothetical protein
LLYLDLVKQEFFKPIFSAMEGTFFFIYLKFNFFLDNTENLGSIKINPDNRLFVIRKDYTVMEINLKLEILKLR